MIRMVKGTYGLVEGGRVRAMTKDSGPFSIGEAREAELVAAGAAVQAEPPARAEKHKNIKTAGSRRAAEDRAADGAGKDAGKEQADGL